MYVIKYEKFTITQKNSENAKPETPL